MVKNKYKKLLTEKIFPLLDQKLTKSKSTLGGTYLYRCPFCGDSFKHKYKGHFKINDDFTYHCFRCGEHGSLNNLFKELGINYKIPKLISYKKKNNSIIINNINFNKNIYYQYRKEDKELCLKYLNYRIGLDENDNLFNLIKKYIVYNPYYFLLKKDNLDINNYLLEQIKNNKYIGFLSFNYSKLILRKIEFNNKNKNNSFQKININLNENTHNDFFIIKNNKIEDMLIKNNPNIVIGEGIFDVLGFYKVLEKENKINNIDLFVASKGVGNINKTIFNIFLKLINKLNLYLLTDHDAFNKMKYIVKKNWHLINQSKIIINKKYKDFGDINLTGYDILEI